MNECIIDYRAGSEELHTPLHKQGVPCALGSLAYGDIFIVGNGPEGCPATVGIEFKRISDVLQCITDGRFTGHQLPGLVTTYQYAYLLVEGAYRPDMRSGILQIRGHKGYWHDASIGGRKFMYRDLMSWLNTMDMRGGIRLQRTYDRTESIFWLAALYHWWTDKEFEEHKSHLAQKEAGDRSVLIKASLMRRIASQLSGVGWEKSGAVCSHFKSIRQMVDAAETDWQEIDGIGKVLSKRIVKELGG